MSETRSIKELHVLPELENLFPPLSDDESAALKEDIGKNGIKYPIIITNKNGIIDGYNRLALAKKAGLTEVPVQVEKVTEINDLINRAYTYNAHRRQLTLTGKVRAAIRWQELVGKPAARKRQGIKGKKEFRKNLPERSSGESRVATANNFCLGSGKQYEKLKDIVENGSLNDWQAIDEGKKSVHKVWTELKNKQDPTTTAQDTSTNPTKNNNSDSECKRLVKRVKKLYKNLDDIEETAEDLSDLKTLQKEITAIAALVDAKIESLNNTVSNLAVTQETAPDEVDNTTNSDLVEEESLMEEAA